MEVTLHELRRLGGNIGALATASDDASEAQIAHQPLHREPATTVPSRWSWRQSLRTPQTPKCWAWAQLSFGFNSSSRRRR